MEGIKGRVYQMSWRAEGGRVLGTLDPELCTLASGPKPRYHQAVCTAYDVVGWMASCSIE